MKKTIASLLAVLTLFTFTSCKEIVSTKSTTDLPVEPSTPSSSSNAVESSLETSPEHSAQLSEEISPSTESAENEPSFVPDYVTGAANTIGNEFSASTYASQSNWIYFSPSGRNLSKFKLGAEKVISVYTASSGNIRNINVIGDWIYFYVENTKEENSYIAKVRTDGTLFETIVSSVFIGDMLIVKDTLFFTTSKNPYSDYAKEAAPLYSVSIKGGIAKQVHDGYVSNLTADGTHIYFLHTAKSGASTICRMKHNATGKTELLTNTPINYFVLENAKLYFLVMDSYSETCTIASIGTSGGGYTTYGKIPYYSEFMYVIGQKAYYFGTEYSETEFCEEFGLVEFNLSTKQYRLVKNYEDLYTFFSVADRLILNQSNSLSVYTPSSDSWKKIPIR